MCTKDTIYYENTYFARAVLRLWKTLGKYGLGVLSHDDLSKQKTLKFDELQNVSLKTRRRYGNTEK
jgi:hypothetical protein